MFEWFNKHKKDVMTYTLWLVIPSFIFLYGYGECAKPALVKWVAKVNGDEVSEQEWLNGIDNLRNRYQQYGQEVDRDRLEAESLESAIISTLFHQKADEFGIDTTDSEVLSSITNSKFFQDEAGNFSKARYDALLYNAGYHPIVYEEQQRETLTRTKLNALLRTSIFPAASELKREKALGEKTVNVEYLAFEPSKYVEDVKVDEEGLKAFFEKNKEDYRVPEQRRIAWAKFVPSTDIADVTYTVTQLERFFNERKNQDYLVPDRVMVQHALYGPEAFIDQASASDEEVRKQFEENPDSYKHPEKVRVRYIEQPLEELVAKQTISDASIQEYYASNLKRFEHPEQAKASHILLKVTPETTPADEETIKTKIADIRKKIVDGELTFEDAAKTYSEGPTGPQGGDLGYFGRDQMGKSFDDVAFSLPLGQISEPVKTQFGYHLIHVVDRREPGTAPLEEVRDSIHDMLKTQTAIIEFRNKYMELKSLDEIGGQYQVKTTDWFARKDVVEGVVPGDLFVFTSAAFVKDPRTPIIFAGNRSTQNLYLIEQMGRIESTPMTFDEAKDAATKDAKQHNALDVAEQMAKADLQRIQDASGTLTLETVVKERGIEPQTTNFFSREDDFILGFGSRPEALKTLAFTLTENEVGGPVPSPNGFHLIRLVARDPQHAPELDEVRDNVVKDYVQAQVESQARNVAIMFSDEAFNKELTIEQCAAQSHIEWGTTELFSANSTIEEFGYQPMIIRQLFQLTQKNPISEPLEIRPPNYSRSSKPLPVTAYYIAQLLETKEPYLPELEEAREDVEKDYKLQLAEPLAEQHANAALEAIRTELASGQPFSASPARAINLKTYDDPDSKREQGKGAIYRGPYDVTGGSGLVGGISGKAIPFIKTALALSSGKVSAPVKVYKEKILEDKTHVQGALTGVYIVQVIGHEIPSEDELKTTSERTIQRLTNQIQPYVFQAWINEVSATSKIIYNDKVLNPEKYDEDEGLTTEESDEDQAS